MSVPNKRKKMENDSSLKRTKKACDYGEKCFRRNPVHFREFSHPHLEAILDAHDGGDTINIPAAYGLQKELILEQLEVIVAREIYVPKKKTVEVEVQAGCSGLSKIKRDKHEPDKNAEKQTDAKTDSLDTPIAGGSGLGNTESTDEAGTFRAPRCIPSRIPDSEYRPIVEPTRRPEEYLSVVLPKGKMAEKHAKSAPYHIFYTTIAAAPETHTQPTSITFQEILDRSLGELKCSLQINFMVEISWLMAQYYFAGYSEKKLTILYGEKSSDLRNIHKKKPQVDAQYISMSTPFGKHHTKMMILCYEDGSMRVVVSTANLYHDDWENRTQGLWFSPRCPELPPDALPYDGDSPTEFKRSLLRYLNTYQMSSLAFYIERVKRCDFSHINVVLVTSAPGSWLDDSWGMSRVAGVLRRHCAMPLDTAWPLVAQASSLGSYGLESMMWLTSYFMMSFTSCKVPTRELTSQQELHLIYPSLENVRQSHDGLLGGGCLPYSGSVHAKQPWLNEHLYQWSAHGSGRHRAMPHLKSYLRLGPDRTAAYFLLTSANLSKAAWGSINKHNGALRILSYEAGVMFMPKFVTDGKFFPLNPGTGVPQLPIPYDLPPVRYTDDMTPWLFDYLSM